MGMSISITIGPYIEVRGKKEIKEIKVKRVCPNHPNQKQGDSKFCSSCGAEIQNSEYEETKIMTPAESFWGIEDFEDSLWSPEYMEDTFLPCTNAPKKIRINTRDGDSVDLTNVEDLKNEQIKWMGTTYQKELEFLEENFGKENVSIKWGIVTYWS